MGVEQTGRKAGTPNAPLLSWASLGRPRLPPPEQVSGPVRPGLPARPLPLNSGYSFDPGSGDTAPPAREGSGEEMGLGNRGMGSELVVGTGPSWVNAPKPSSHLEGSRVSSPAVGVLVSPGRGGAGRGLPLPPTPGRGLPAPSDSAKRR